jgi:hypothetical protein
MQRKEELKKRVDFWCLFLIRCGKCAKSPIFIIRGAKRGTK